MRDEQAILSAVDEVRRKLDAHRPYTPDVVKRLDRWLAPRFVYCSSALGDPDSLSASETAAFMEREIVSGGHHLDKFLAVSRHQAALELAQQRAREEGTIDIPFLQALHRTLYGSGPRAGRMRPGSWKDEPSPQTRRRGHLFSHALPEEVDGLMQELMAGLNAQRANEHPLRALTWFYFHLYRIQPFVHGNGKVGRLACLTALLNHGYPPLIIQPDGLGEYMDALAGVDRTVTQDKRGFLAPGYDLGALLEFFGGHLKRAGESMLDVVTGRRLTVGTLAKKVGESQQQLMTRLLTRRNTSWRLRATVEIRALHARVLQVLEKFCVVGPIYRIELARQEVVPTHAVAHQLVRSIPGADAGLVGEAEMVIRAEATTKGVVFPEPLRLTIGVVGTSVGLRLILKWNDGGEAEVKHGPQREAEWPSVTIETVLLASVDQRRRRFEAELDRANATASQRLRALRQDSLKAAAEAEDAARGASAWDGQRVPSERSTPGTGRSNRADSQLDGVTPSEPPLSF